MYAAESQGQYGVLRAVVMGGRKHGNLDELYMAWGAACARKNWLVWKLKTAWWWRLQQVIGVLKSCADREND